MVVHSAGISSPVYFGWLTAAKYAEAFFRNAISFSCSATCLRKRVSSVRSATVNGSSLRAAAASVRRRSSATYRPSRPSFTPGSRATSAIVPESITRWAASTLFRS